jgi:solute carrier family 27 fatty acid transporter 1/4
MTLGDELLHIYTSGTTGLPKAAIIRGFRAMFMCGGIGAGCRLTSDDVIYNALPLYHSNGGLGLAGNAIRIGTTIVVRKKFSASRYFEDCTKHGVTVINYIGETCRYLLATPPKDTDKAHKIRVATGNGLRASIWQEFQDRFNIPLCVEFYGATEGNANMINTVGKVGAVGFNSVIVPWIFPVKLIKVDKDTGDLIRGSNGFAIECGPNEPGLLVGKVKKDVMHRFDGYLNQKATQKKVAYDVFSKGDSCFLTGDMLMQDEEGFFFFQDRTGDTFRWKGENVSTNEVEGVISKSLELSDVCVYGVEVPGIEGRAGMACLSDPYRQANLDELQKAMEVSLPPYARPVFIRQTGEIAKTGTFKFKKNKLRDEGFNPAACDATDHLFYLDGKQKKYLPIDSTVYQSILDQEIRF